MIISRAHEEYVSQQKGVDWYRRGVAEVTGQFQSLSQEVIVCIGELRGRGLGGVAAILENIQEQEKEKLQLVSLRCVSYLDKLSLQVGENDPWLLCLCLCVCVCVCVWGGGGGGGGGGARSNESCIVSWYVNEI